MAFMTDFTTDYKADMNATYWPGRLITDYLDEHADQRADKAAVVTYNSATGVRTRLSFLELQVWVDRLAAALRAAGVAAADVVSVQLPNWWHIAALHMACVRIGAVTNVLMPIFRERELEFMLTLAGSKVFVCPSSFRGYSYRPIANHLRREVRSLQEVVVIETESDGVGFPAEFLACADAVPAPAAATFTAMDPDDVIQIAFTSGTTGEPKGVVQTANTLLSNAIPFCERLQLDEDDVFMMSSPLAHQTGFIYGLLAPVCVGATTVLQDVWDPICAAEIMAAEHVTFTMGAPTFLHDLTDIGQSRRSDFQSLELYLAAGAPIPVSLVEKAQARLGIKVVRGWGMTETGAVSVSGPGDDAEKAAVSDGRALPGVELEAFDEAGQMLPRGQAGTLKVRSCSMFGGYAGRPSLKDLDAAGWFDTGDIGMVDSDGFLRITDRAKDLVIRGGENIPVVEIEGLLHRISAVRDVAIVGMPDDRLGERACAFVVAQPGYALTLEDISEYLIANDVARQYLPERLVLMDVLPKTPTGKVQKYVLREEAAALVQSDVHRGCLAGDTRPHRSRTPGGG